MRGRAVPADAWALEGYVLTGAAHVVRWSRFSDFTGPLVIVVEYAGRGGGWMRFGRKIDVAGWDVTHYKTRGAAERGMFG